MGSAAARWVAEGWPAGLGGPAAGAQGHPESRDVAFSVALERTRPSNKNGCCLSC